MNQEKLKPEIIDELFSSKDSRLFICDKDPLYFAMYYFGEMFSHPLANFHYDFYEDIRTLSEGTLDEAAWCAFRESGKTSIAKYAMVIWSICFGKKKYINYDCYDKGNAEAALFDIVLTLQTNERIIRDFGHLYFRKRTKGIDSGDEAQLKRVNNFITENGTKVEAFSTQESTRGRVFGVIRPDLFVLDDFETSKTKDSYPITKKIIDHIDEMKAGLGANGSILYLCNYITDDGVVSHIEAGMKRNPRAVFRNIPVYFEGQLAWPGKFTDTDIEAAEINKAIENPLKRKISLEAKRRALGDKVFETEMMNDPSRSEDYYGDRELLKEMMKKCKPPEERVAGMKIWAKYNAKHNYAVGGDTSEGIGQDANAAVAIDFSTRPARVVATYENNEIKPDVFAWELRRMGNTFGKCMVVPEINNTGFATVAELTKDKDDGGCGYDNVFQREEKHKYAKGRLVKEYGFRSTRSTKPDVVAQFFSAVQDGDLIIYDRDLLNEMYHYKNRDVHLLKVEEGMTRHFDKLMAACLAWEARRLVKPKDDDESDYNPKLPDYDPEL